MKLLGNSSYGKTIIRVENHMNISYLNSVDYQKALKIPRHFGTTTLGEDLHEVRAYKKQVVHNLPVQIGFFVYAYAKLRMLEFIFDCLDKFVCRADYQLMEMDTDSAYLALAGPSLEALIKPELKVAFYSEIEKWFPVPACDGHMAAFKHTKCSGRDWVYAGDCCRLAEKSQQRTPGLFKIEWRGDAMVCLSPKCYIALTLNDAGAYDEGATKCSTKGLVRAQNKFTIDDFRTVLTNAESGIGRNRGFQCVDRNVVTYTQTRAGLSYFYAKRKVLEDRVTTEPLYI